MANISHDLRTPLSLIYCYAEMMHDFPGEVTPEQSQVIMDEAQRLSTLVSDVLDITKLESGIQDLKPAEFSLTECIRASTARLSELIRKDGYTITFDCDRDVKVVADETKITQAFYNLLINAVNYTGSDKQIAVRQLADTDTVRIEIKPDGIVEVITGVASIGQGVETVIAQICADALGVDYGNIRVIHGQTERIARGMGAFASRVTVMCGEATRLAATKLRARLLQAAAEQMQTRADALDIMNGEIVRVGTPGPSMPLAELARALPDGLSAEDTFESTHMVYPYGGHVAVVRVDADTGNVAIERYAIAYDIGKAVNPKLVEGQITGGLAQGVGGALLEEFRYDQNGEPLSVTFADYLMPTAREVPEVSIIVSEDAPSPLNPLGLKGAGEGGANPVGAVIASAIDEALQRPGAVTHLPVTPQRLKKILQDTHKR
jgi:CO/xanthine dehydrogenase Mo-binding subunit